MNVPMAFLLIGSIILIGFLSNLLFRITKVPSVLLLIAIGILLGPVTGWISSNLLITIAPFFGTLALMIILFEGGLELDIESALKQAPRAALLSFLVFLFSFISVASFAYFVIGMPVLHSFIIAGVLGATSPAIVIPIVSGLSIRKEIKTMLKLESALGDVLLIVTVLILLDIHSVGAQSVSGIASVLFLSFATAVSFSVVAGVLWSRFIGWQICRP